MICWPSRGVKRNTEILRFAQNDLIAEAKRKRPVERVTLHGAFAFRVEDDIQGDLRVERLAGSDTGGALEEVEHLDGELGLDGVIHDRELVVLEHGQVR